MIDQSQSELTMVAAYSQVDTKPTRRSGLPASEGSEACRDVVHVRLRRTIINKVLWVSQMNEEVLRPTSILAGITWARALGVGV